MKIKAKLYLTLITLLLFIVFPIIVFAQTAKSNCVTTKIGAGTDLLFSLQSARLPQGPLLDLASRQDWNALMAVAEYPKIIVKCRIQLMTHIDLNSLVARGATGDQES